MIADNDVLEAHPSPQKIAPVHLQRLAVVYVRQSTAQQVLRHEESTRLQYGLAGRARRISLSTQPTLILNLHVHAGRPVHCRTATGLIQASTWRTQHMLDVGKKAAKQLDYRTCKYGMKRAKWNLQGGGRWFEPSIAHLQKAAFCR